MFTAGLIIIGIVIFLLLVAWSLARMVAPASQAERDADDVNQIQYLADWAERQK